MAGIAPRVAIVAAHPDDECIGVGGQLRSLEPVAIVHVTDGAPRERRWWGAPELPSREAYAALRRRELAAALAMAGVGGAPLHELGIVDQEASCHLAGLTERLVEVLGALECDVVLTHPYEGGHPDHDATSFAVHAACRLMAARGARMPRVVEFASYHRGPNGALTAGVFLPADSAGEIVLSLSEGERERKRRMLAAFGTQRATLARFPIVEERIRPAPAYDFTAPPHEGRLFYEHFAWGCTGQEWCARARAALHLLGLRNRVT